MVPVLHVTLPSMRLVRQHEAHGQPLKRLHQRPLELPGSTAVPVQRKQHRKRRLLGDGSSFDE